MKKITHLIICSLLLVMAACEKDTEPANFAPKLATGEATNIIEPELLCQEAWKRQKEWW